MPAHGVPVRHMFGIKGRMFAYLALFVAFVLGVLWLFQVVWLDSIYQSIKLMQLKNGVQILAKGIDAGQENVQTLTNRVAYERDMCVEIYKIDGMMASEYASAHPTQACYLHNMADMEKSRLYGKTARSDNGEYMEKVMLSKVFGTSDTVIRAKLAYGGDGAEYLILLNSTLTPVEATVDTLTTQLIWISVILLTGALFLALYISKKVTAPIVGMNTSAKVLAQGNYDVTFSGGEFRELAELGDTLNYAARELSKVDGIQKELIANISHDLRTPLTMIAGYSEVMRDIPGEMTPENMQIIIDETNRLSSLVNDLLDVSKMNSGTQKLNYSLFSLTEAVDATMLRYRKLTERDGYQIIFEHEDEAIVRADKTRILQVLYNLINNAINYTGADKRVTVRQLMREHVVRIEVEDTGEGIDEEMLPLIWERYFKVDKVHKRAAVGTGLGLSIVKKILTMHGAHFGVSSVVGKGSIFWFELSTDETAEANTEMGVEK